MIIALAIIGAVAIALGAAFYWLNLNTPIQTCLPAVLIPAGLVSVALALGGWLL